MLDDDHFTFSLGPELEIFTKLNVQSGPRNAFQIQQKEVYSLSSQIPTTSDLKRYTASSRGQEQKGKPKPSQEGHNHLFIFSPFTEWGLHYKSFVRRLRDGKTGNKIWLGPSIRPSAQSTSNTD